MDRRGFLTGAGTLGATVAGGWAAADTAGSTRAASLAKSAGATPGRGANALLPEGLSLGYLPGSAGLLRLEAEGRDWDSLATQARWAQWEPGLAPPTLDTLALVSLGALQRAAVPGAPDVVRGIEVIAHFAADRALASPEVVPFEAWRYDAPGVVSRRGAATSPLTFNVAMPDRVALQVNYALDSKRVASRVRDAGLVYVPIGGDGAGPGMYVLAGPSRVTGQMPDFAQYRFSGDLAAPLIHAGTYGTPEFDFLPLTVRAA